MASLLKCENLRYAAGGARIVDGLSCEALAGEHMLIAGDSGSGKTTVLHLMSGLLRPDSGNILFDGDDLAHMPAARLDKMRGRNFGFVFQNLHLVTALNVADNLALARYAAGLPRDAARIRGVLGGLGLSDKMQRRVSSLSRGEAQRLAIARAVINDPKVIFADEPTSALDDANAENVMALLEAQAEAGGATLIVATHDARIKNRFGRTLALGGKTGGTKEEAA